jgi:hypothetical protein
VLSQARIGCGCAFTYMNAVFRKNLTEALAVGANDVDTAFDTRGALSDGRDRARFCRTTATCIWGVSDPLPAEAWGRDRGWQSGSLTPRMSRSLLRRPRSQRHGGTKRRPLRCSELVQGQGHVRINVSRNRIEAVARLTVSITQTGGTLLPRLCSPLFSPVERSKRTQPGVGREPGETRGIAVTTGPASAREAASLRASRLRRSTGARLARCPPGALRVLSRQC